MLRFMLILQASSEERHTKVNVEPEGISMIKYLDMASISFRLAASAYVVYRLCLQPLNIGIEAWSQYDGAVAASRDILCDIRYLRLKRQAGALRHQKLLTRK